MTRPIGKQKKNRIFAFTMKKKDHTDSRQMNLFAETDWEQPVQTYIPRPIVTEYDHCELFHRLAQSKFRSKFRLTNDDIAYIHEKGLPVIRQHATDFIAKRLAPAVIPNDGKQTPMRGHPFFIAQHATGCCCRGCFSKWHHIPAGRQLTEAEQQYAVSVLMEWIERQLKK